MIDWSEVEESQLLEMAQNGEAEAFGELYSRYANRVFRFLYAHVSHRLDAEDITGEVFINVWRSLPRYRDQGVPFISYIFRVAHNLLIDYYRKSNRAKQEVPIEHVVIEDGTNDPIQKHHQAAESEEVVKTLESLRPDQRMVLTLRFFSDLSIEEIAQVMEKSPGAVRVIQHRALASLRKRLQ